MGGRGEAVCVHQQVFLSISEMLTVTETMDILRTV